MTLSLKETPLSLPLDSAYGARLGIAAGLMACSGFAGLGYQIVWTQQFGVWLGHEIIAVLAVVAAFFGGLALGAVFLGRRIGMSDSPARWYAGCEALIGIWGLVLSIFLLPANTVLASLTGPQPSTLWQWSIAFLGPFFLLLPATFAMGATLPAIEGVTKRLRAQGFALGGLYAANTLGGLIGVLATSFFLIPQVGLQQTALLCVAVSLSCAVMALFLFPQSGSHFNHVMTDLTSEKNGLRRQFFLLLFWTGLLGIGYEVVVVRALSQVAEDTVYTFAILLAIYLLGTAGGAAVYQRYLSDHTDSPRLRDQLFASLCAAILLSFLAIWQSESIKLTSNAWLGSGVMPALATEAMLALTAFALPTFSMGALFSHLSVEAKDAGLTWGSAIGINTLGAALAPVLFGVLLLPLLGIKFLLLFIALAYLPCVARQRWRQFYFLVPALSIILLFIYSPELRFLSLPESGKVISYRDGVMASVSVIEDADGVARLRINNHQQEGSSASGLTDARQAYLPLLLHPQAHSALFLGLGTGVTASAAAEDPLLKVDAVELLPEVIAASDYFRTGLDNPEAAARLNIIAGDARRYVRASHGQYDVIVADLFHPARSGAGALYTVEHFSAIKARLAKDGLFCQWLPLHQLDLETLRSIVHSFISVYPDAKAIIATNSLSTPVIGLISRPDLAHFNLQQISNRLAVSQGQQRRAQLNLKDEFSLLGSFIAGPAALKHFAASAPLNTDDRPTVIQHAPFATYAPEALPHERLLALKKELGVTPEELLGPALTSKEREWQNRLMAYGEARDQFLVLGVGIRPDPDPRVMLAQLQKPLLELVRHSPDFRPAYDPLLSMAMAMVKIDKSASLDLLTSLMQAQPARMEAGLALTKLRSDQLRSVP